MRYFYLILTTCVLLTGTLVAAGQAPDFKLKRMNGGEFILSEELKKGPVLIDFWATWCKPCKKALPKIEYFHKTYADSGLQVVTISIDNPKSKSKIKPFIKGQKYTFDVLFDSNMEVRKLFGGKEIPLSVLINSDSEIVFKHLGYKPGDEKKIEEEILKTLGIGETSSGKDTNEEND
ncbi:MAG: TlpA family protein disulfide reductase [Calditrichaeota bacterium]|nr:TlpA family protein disulfide reductase [Calditrichota bacterium]